jgi:hypothetical protein
VAVSQTPDWIKYLSPIVRVLPWQSAPEKSTDFVWSMMSVVLVTMLKMLVLVIAPVMLLNCLFI